MPQSMERLFYTRTWQTRNDIVAVTPGLTAPRLYHLTVDEYGNLVYDKTARNFNPEMATAADLVIAQVDEIVSVGALDPEAVVTPHLLVDHLVLAP